MVIKNKRPRPSQKASAQDQTRVKKLVVLIGFLALLWFLFAPGLGLVSYMQKKSELAQVKRQANQLQKANVELQEEIDKLLNDQVYLEKLAREKYDLLKPNEKVYDFSKKSKK
ncbi:MAG: cell division protein FtsB [Desulforhopalus sp.]|jgi:cell division protein FtsB